MTTDDNFKSVLAGRSELRVHRGTFGLREEFCASLFDREAVSVLFEQKFGSDKGFAFFEKLCILSAYDALNSAVIDTARRDVVFVFSSTKGNVERLETGEPDDSCLIGSSAARVAQFFGNENTPIIASNACISGVCAQIAAVRALLAGRYRIAVVIGADVLSKFIVSGFQSFKALSPENCRPYDKLRQGLNLGEAAGTVILKSELHESEGAWRYVSSSVHNDANHISGPSRTGEGAYRVLRDIVGMTGLEELAFVSTHGTASNYNDEMESIAIHRAGLDSVPVTGLKGFYGHTLGAAGVIETILAMKAIDAGVVLPTRGYSVQGTTFRLNLSADFRTTDKKEFIKMLSGFGGSNAGIAYRKGGTES